MRKALAGTALLGLLAAALAAGCLGSGSAGGAGADGATSDPARRPAFLVYETSGRKTVLNDLGRSSEIQIADRVWARAGAMRTEDRRSGRAAILRLDRKLYWDLDSGRHVCSEATFRDISAAADVDRRKLVAILTAAEQNGSDPARRRQLETLRGQRQPVVEVKEDAERQVILGHPCRRLRFYEDGELRIDGWAAEDLDSPCDPGEFLAATGDFSPGLLAELRRRPGLFLRKKTYGRLLAVPRVAESEVVKLETPPQLDPALFEVPPGYTRAK